MNNLLSGTAEVQEALFTALSTLDNVRVYDSVPESPINPYIRIGDDSVIESETKDDILRFIDTDINVFSEYKGYSEIKSLVDLVINKIMDINTLINGTTVEFWSLNGIEFYRDDDSRRATISARFIIAQ